jgi:CRISPR/Cas system-associated exonuclease Cas4 (RecB family)
MIKSVRHIQIKQVAYCPNIFKAIITYRPHPTEYDESDDLEYQKELMNKLIDKNWFRNISIHKK